MELKEEITAGKGQVYYNDLDHDGKSERIFLQENVGNAGRTAIAIYNYNEHYYSVTTRSNKLLNSRWVRNSRAFFEDYDADGYNEVFFFTVDSNSLFINCYSVLSDTIISKYIGEVCNDNDIEDFSIQSSDATDLNRDGKKEIIFTVRDDWCAKHRKLYAIDWFNDTIYSSKEMYVYLQGAPKVKTDTILQNTFIICDTYASSNYSGSNLDVLNDSSSYLLVFDTSLNFAFKPISTKGYTTSITSDFISYEGNLAVFTRINSLIEDTLLSTKLMVLNMEGEILKQSQPDRQYRISHAGITEIAGQRTPYTISDFNRVTFYNSYLTAVGSFVLPFKGRKQMQVDLDLNGEKEFIFGVLDKDELVITQSDFSNPVYIDFPYEPKNINYTVKKNGNEPPWFSINTSGLVLNYCYYRNPYHFLKLPFYVAVFIFLYLLLVVSKKIRNEVYLRREKEIIKLRYSSITNQMDPHFTLNVLNSISGLYGEKQKEEADKYLARFSRLMHQSLVTGRQISTSLREELEFTRDFIEIQQVRFGHPFDYEIEVDERTDLNSKMPRMLIHTFVENSIKHGLLPLDKKGFLMIDIKSTGKKMLVTITDNGIGRDESIIKGTSGTGKGLQIVNQTLQLYKKLTGVRISFLFEDIREHGQTGTIVKITIPKH